MVKMIDVRLLESPPNPKASYDSRKTRLKHSRTNSKAPHSSSLSSPLFLSSDYHSSIRTFRPGTLDSAHVNRHRNLRITILLAIRPCIYNNPSDNPSPDLPTMADASNTPAGHNDIDSVEDDLERLIRKEMQDLSPIITKAVAGALTNLNLTIGHIDWPSSENDDTQMSLSLLTYYLTPPTSEAQKRGEEQEPEAENFLVRYALPTTQEGLKKVQKAMQTEYAALNLIHHQINLNRTLERPEDMGWAPVPVPTVLAYNMEYTKDADGKVVYGPYLLMKIQSTSAYLQPLLAGDESCIPNDTPRIWNKNTNTGSLRDPPPRELVRVVEELARHQYSLYLYSNTNRAAPIGSIGVSMDNGRARTQVGRFQFPIRIDARSKDNPFVGGIPDINNSELDRFSSIWKWFSERLHRVVTNRLQHIPRTPVDKTDVPDRAELQIANELVDLATTVLKLESEKKYANSLKDISDERNRGTFLQPGGEFDTGTLLVDEKWNLVAIVDWQDAKMVPPWRVGMAPKFIRGPTIHEGHIEKLDLGEISPNDLGLADTDAVGLMHQKYKLRMAYNKSISRQFSAYPRRPGLQGKALDKAIEAWYIFSGHAYFYGEEIPRFLCSKPKRRSPKSAKDRVIRGRDRFWETLVFGRDFDILLMALEGPSDSDPCGYLHGLRSEHDSGVRDHFKNWLDVFKAYLASKEKLNSEVVVGRNIAGLASFTTEEDSRQTDLDLVIDERYSPFTARMFYSREPNGYQTLSYRDIRLGQSGEAATSSTSYKRLALQQDLETNYIGSSQDINDLVNYDNFSSDEFESDESYEF